ncbi:MAG: hypothetical protein GY950_02025 [bacterium]|nr:hypothetical protein [bacterium]
MKTKTFEKSLILNKETIADLNRAEMAALHGGGIDKPMTCPCYPDPMSEQTSCTD